MLLPVRTVAPVTALLSAADLKAQTRIDGNTEDALLDALIAAATAALDGYAGVLGRALVTQTWTQGFAGFADVLRLPLTPVQSVTISYVDADGAPQALTLADAYRLHADAQGAYLRRIADAVLPGATTRDDAVMVTMVCGYGAPVDVPADIRQAALLIAAHLFEHREAAGVMQFHELPLGAQWLLERHRRVGV